MPEPTVTDQLVSDHAELYDTLVARRYFAKFDRITGHLGRVAAEMETEGRLTRTEARVLGKYLTAVAATFRALNHKYLMTGRGETAPRHHALSRPPETEAEATARAIAMAGMAVNFRAFDYLLEMVAAERAGRAAVVNFFGGVAVIDREHAAGFP